MREVINLEGFIPVKLNPVKNKLQLFSKNKTPFLEVGDITTYEQEEGGEKIEPRSNFDKTKTL